MFISDDFRSDIVTPTMSADGVLLEEVITDSDGVFEQNGPTHSEHKVKLVNEIAMQQAVVNYLKVCNLFILKTLFFPYDIPESSLLYKTYFETDHSVVYVAVNF